MKLLNAFSIQMCPQLDGNEFNIKFSPISESLVRSMIGNGPTDQYVNKVKFESFIGHADTANVLSKVLGVPVAFNRKNVSLEHGETALIAQYMGGRLPEGATELPEGTSFKWFLVTIS